jgi:response regulator RpfG family c-di-GMP phosphodiesterase
MSMMDEANSTQKRILVVDDRPEVLSSVNHILHGLYNVYVAKNTLKAFGTLHDEHIDLILLDVQMPGMDGVEFLSYIRENKYYPEEPVPVIIMSSDSRKELIFKSAAFGIKAFIKKPLEPDILKAKISAVFETDETEAVNDEAAAGEQKSAEQHTVTKGTDKTAAGEQKSAEQHPAPKGADNAAAGEQKSVDGGPDVEGC